MAISQTPSTTTMPRAEKPYPRIIEFLCEKFPAIKRETWEDRIRCGKVLGEDGSPITSRTEYTPLARLHYFREVEVEPVIPFSETIIFQNNEIIVAHKPHFLPVTPSGPYVGECLLNRLKKKTGNMNLIPVNRIDRETAGLVLFSVNPISRGAYQQLFMDGNVEKTYDAVALPHGFTPKESRWLVENRLVKGTPWFRMKVDSGPVNARSEIELVGIKDGKAYFKLKPITGKKHQLRIHMSGLGFRILNDHYYPELLNKQKDDFSNPLQLLARELKFKDPVSGNAMTFRSPVTL